MVVLAIVGIRRSSGLQKFTHSPNVVGNAGFHSWSAAQRFVDASEVIPRVPKDHRCPVVLPLFREAVRQASEPAKAHAKRKIAALHYRSADALRIRLPHDRDNLR